MNVPIGVLAFVLAALFVPESRAIRARPIDPIGQLLVLVLLSSLTYAIIHGPGAGWGSAETITLFAIALVALVGLLSYEPRRPDPLIELRFFRSIPFSGATLIAISAFGSFSGFLFMTTLYLQDVRGLDPLDAGLFLLPMASVTLLLAPLSGRMVANRGPRLPLFIAGAAITLAGLSLTGLTAHTSYGWLIASIVLYAIGFGAVNAPITNTAVSGMPRAQAGVAAAVASTSRQIGAALGVAIVGSVLNSGPSGRLPADLATASHPGWWIVTGAGFAVLLLGVATTGRRARASAVATAQLLKTDAPELSAVGSGTVGSGVQA